ncbi:MAG: DotD/TraH family lipoprotein [Albidovulum sp.]|nr:DotD/TraH family lipoprotein [Albidovulum sp.]
MGEPPGANRGASMIALSQSRMGMALILVLATASCFATQPRAPEPSPEDSDLSEAAILQAAEAATEAKREASHALETPIYSPPPPREIETLENPPSGDQTTLNYTIEWNGPIEPLLTALAKSMNASLAIRGAARGSKVNVALYVYEARIANIIRELEGQLAESGEIGFSPVENRISLDYGQ